MDTGICYIIDENGYIMFISQQEGIDRNVSDEFMNKIDESVGSFFRRILGNFSVNSKVQLCKIW